MISNAATGGTELTIMSSKKNFGILPLKAPKIQSILNKSRLTDSIVSVTLAVD